MVSIAPYTLETVIVMSVSAFVCAIVYAMLVIANRWEWKRWVRPVALALVLAGIVSLWKMRLGAIFFYDGVMVMLIVEQVRMAWSKAFGK
jgi:hypothetical protein